MFTELARCEGAWMGRHGRFIAAFFERPHLVLSTSAVHGGQTDHLTHIANHQSCEGSGHAGKEDRLHQLQPPDYHEVACGEASLPTATTALLGTAASMDYAAFALETWQEMQVLVCATGGVRGNAARVGDNARWHEVEGRWTSASALEEAATAATLPTRGDPVSAIQAGLKPGTINTLVVVNRALTPAALARTVAALSEAKCAVLQELAVPSLQGFGSATGTGTDQYAIASPLPRAGEKPLTWSGHHTKVGELLGQACLKAYRETLRWQNGLEPSLTRNLAWAGKGLGLTESLIREGLDQALQGPEREVALRNLEALLHHPKAAAAIYAMHSLEERARYGTLPVTLMPELRLEHALLLARQVASRSDDGLRDGFSKPPPATRDAAWRTDLSPLAGDAKALIVKALALGFAAKWA